MTPCSRLRYATFIAMAPAECEPEPDCDPNGVLATCLTLHSVSTRAVTEWDEDRDTAELLRMEAYLQRKLDNWTDYPPKGPAPGAFDHAVKELVRIALVEWRARPRHPRAKHYGLNWAVTARYAGVPGSRPETRRHPAPEDFVRRTVVGPANAITVEALLDLLEVPESDRVRIRANSVVKNFVEGRLIPDQPYPHHANGGRYISDAPNAPLAEWSISFAFVTPTTVD